MTAECDIHLTSGDWVDLGLPSGLLWATRNVGASSPTDYGNYYAWGEIHSRSVLDVIPPLHSPGTYRYARYNYYEITKYTERDGLTTLQPDDDAATANYGGRTPTMNEWQELIDNTTSCWTTINGANGRCFTGLNGHRLFLPAAGYSWWAYSLRDSDGQGHNWRNSSLHNVSSHGYYWSSSRHWGDSDDAMGCFFNSNRVYVDDWMQYGSRAHGFSVRAVR